MPVKFPSLPSDYQIGEIDLWPGTLLRVALVECNGHQRLDVRAWVEDHEGEIVPTPRGVSLHVQKIPALVRLLEDAERMVVESGLGHPVDSEA